MKRWDEAERHFKAGLDHSLALKSPTFTALNRSEHARMLLERNGPDDREGALDLLADAEAICEERGMGGLLERVRTDRAKAQQGGR
jgi:hypothetical protein